MPGGSGSSEWETDQHRLRPLLSENDKNCSERCWGWPTRSKGEISSEGKSVTTYRLVNYVFGMNCPTA